MGPDSRSSQPPKLNKHDIAHNVSKAVISLVPIIGGSAAELFELILAPPISKRRDEWMESIAEGLSQLEDKFKEFKKENLKDKDSFVTTALNASQIAIRNHRKDKIEALRNAVLNSALPNAPEDDIQLMFLGFVDDLTSWHLKILAFLDNPIEELQRHEVSHTNIVAGALSTLLTRRFPKIVERRDFYDHIIKDLYLKGLSSTENVHVMMTSDGLSARRTTDLGSQFLSFIKSPLSDS